MNPLKLKYHTYYDFDQARAVEYWTLWEYRRGTILGKYKWREKSTWRYPDGGKAYAHGDLEWAKRIAKDCNIDIPRAPVDGEQGSLS